MSVYEGQAQLGRAMKDLLADWERTRLNWNDSTSQQFAEKHLPALESDVRTALTAMTQMDQVLSQVRRDCG